MRRAIVATVLIAFYIGTIVAANWATVHFGPVPVGLGLVAPAGVYFAGLAFTLRDLLHRAAGSAVVVIAIGTGGALSYILSTPALAIASATAFTVSELADLAVYQPLHRRRWLTAVVASNVVGFAVDSVLFLLMAFGSLAFLPGQLLGKALMTGLAWLILAVARRRQIPASA